MINELPEIQFIDETVVTVIPKPFPNDEEATWVYWTSVDTLDRGISDEWVWDRLRLRRDQLLKETDYRMVVDAPWALEPWTLYRQALRDLPKKTKNPRLAEWPEVP